MSTEDLMGSIGRLSSAEEFLDFFEVAYRQSVVNVNRLHILKRFNQYISAHSFSGKSSAEIREEYRSLLERAYCDFEESDALTEKVFKVFQDAAGVRTFSVDKLRASLAVRRG